MMFGYDQHMDGWTYALMSVAMIALWGALVVGLVVLLRRRERGGAVLTHRDPQQRLAERFADGDIDADEYRDRLVTLREHAAH